MEFEIVSPLSCTKGEDMTGSKRILLVDDDDDQLMLLSALLERESYQVTSAAGGDEALELLRTEPFDLILADISMPDMNGLDLACEARKLAGGDRIPIVLLTAGIAPVDFSQTSFRADMFFLKQNLKHTLLPGLRSLLYGKPNTGTPKTEILQ